MSEPAGLTNHLGFWLRQVSNQVSHAFARKVERRGVTVAEWVVLRQLWQAPTIPSQLADALGLTRGAVSKLAERLLAKGLLSREPDASDGRVQILALTGSGMALVPELAALADRNEEEFFGALSDAERMQLEQILRRLADLNAARAVPID